ncbi:choice-of-anchor P family protein [Amycolatopsis sp. SID8362]|uniref:choice-of-anchor P family protein n=1 Tax=Amycolatopsis sp. SID8362 TaxID=2690346 RepID=UPI001371A854|nr:choice-of-anchor P family protein [Amycolatopsis sp. SID8362]NBH10392.1 hypothetical protein [Amycolatopsis sp. SID8362]NED47087.1 hypothetical protein [Amycolatopsis sp. SID8362]
MRFSALRSTGVVGLAAAGLFAAAVPAQAAQAAGSGSAYGASITATVGPVSVTTGQLAPTNTSNPGNASTGLVNVPTDLLTVGAITSISEIDTSNNVTEIGTVFRADSQLLRLHADLLRARCNAYAADVTATNPGGLTGLSEITNLTIGSTTITPTGDVSQTQTIDGVGTIILNEQTTNSDGSLTVNALHIKIDPNIDPTGSASGDIILGSATCGTYLAPAATPTPTPTTTPPTTPPGGDSGTSGSGSGTGSVVPEGAPETGDGSEAAVTAL